MRRNFKILTFRRTMSCSRWRFVVCFEMSGHVLHKSGCVCQRYRTILFFAPVDVAIYGPNNVVSIESCVVTGHSSGCHCQLNSPTIIAGSHVALEHINTHTDDMTGLDESTWINSIYRETFNMRLHTAHACQPGYTLPQACQLREITG